MHKVGTLLQFIGGAITRAAGTAMVVGVFMIVVGLTPAEFVAWVFNNPPSWLNSIWFRPLILVLGLVVIGASVHFNRWSLQQKVIDDLAEDMSWAISDLLNKRPDIKADGSEIEKWEARFREWCAKVSKKLENRAVFTRADQLHFDRLGFVNPVALSGHERLDWLLSQLKLKFERLRDLINWVQQRRR